MALIEQVAIFLAAAVLAIPLFRRLGLGAVLGYLAAGMAIGPWGAGLVEDVERTLQFGEIGVVFLMFVIGLELQTSRLRVMRRWVFGAGVLQIVPAAAALSALTWLLGVEWRSALVIGFALSLSSTAFVLQLLAERRELATSHGRGAFGILLFQDLAAIPAIAFVPLLAPSAQAPGTAALFLELGVVVAAILGLVVAGHFLLRPVFRLIAATRNTEVFTAGALLLVLGSAMLMEHVGLSMELGAFIAGVLVAESEYRHQLEADIEPFKGLLLGLFFMGVGMTVDLSRILAQPLLIAGLAAGLITVKALLLYPVGRRFGLPRSEALRLALVLAQGGEFAFVLFAAALEAGVLGADTSGVAIAAVIVSMAATPLLVIAASRLSRRLTPAPAAADLIPDLGSRVVIVGFGRFGQVIGRFLGAQGVSFTALEASPTQVDFVRQFGHRIYYGDGTQLELLRQAGVGRAKAFVLAVDDVNTSLRIARLVRTHFPDVRLYARARNRIHAHRLMDLDVHGLIRENVLSSLWLAGEVMVGLGYDRVRVDHAKGIFEKHDQRTLARQHAVADDRKALVQSAREAADELRDLFESDRDERPR